MKTLTTLETLVLTRICQELEIWRDSEPGYSCIDYRDLRGLKLGVHTLAGVLGSLVNKDLIAICDEKLRDVDLKGIIYPRWENIDTNFGRSTK